MLLQLRLLLLLLLQYLVSLKIHNGDIKQYPEMKWEGIIDTLGLSSQEHLGISSTTLSPKCCRWWNSGAIKKTKTHTNYRLPTDWAGNKMEMMLQCPLKLLARHFHVMVSIYKDESYVTSKCERSRFSRISITVLVFKRLKSSCGSYLPTSRISADFHCHNSLLLRVNVTYWVLKSSIHGNIFS